MTTQIDTEAILGHCKEINKSLRSINDQFTNLSAKERDNWLFNCSDNDFNLYCVNALTSQSYGAKFQERFRRKYNLDKVKASLNRGDIKSKTLHFEYKMSLLKADKEIVNIVQIRPDHSIDHYIVEVYDARSLDHVDHFKTFCLTKDQMLEECVLYGNCPAHGNKGIATELRIDLKINSPAFDRWIKDYSFDESIFT